MKRVLPQKTVERLSKYRRFLTQWENPHYKEYIYSHELADYLHITPVQIRHDLMLLGYSAVPGRGYHVTQLIRSIDRHVENGKIINAAIIGMGKLGHAFLNYVNSRNTNLKVIAAFDIDPRKINTVTDGIPCHHINLLTEIAPASDIKIGIITTGREAANEVKEILIRGKIKGILNYTTMPLTVPDDVFLEEYDILTTFEKVAYFVKNQRKKSLFTA